jgi:hypothetical protein
MFLCFYGKVLVTSFTVILRPLDYGTATRGNQSLTEVLSRNLPGKSEESQEKPARTAGDSAENLTGNLRHCYTNQWIFFFVILMKRRHQFSVRKCVSPCSPPFRPSLSSYYFADSLSKNMVTLATWGTSSQSTYTPCHLVKGVLKQYAMLQFPNGVWILEFVQNKM